MRKKEIIIDNLKIGYFESDDFAPAVPGAKVFLPGWKADATVFRNILSRLDNWLAVDLPGFGANERAKETWGVGDYADWLDKFLAKINTKNPILIGHSFGGSVIIKYLSTGGQAARAVLIDSAGVRKKGVKIFIYRVIAKLVKVFLWLPPFIFARRRIRRGLYHLIGSGDYIETGNMKDVYQKIIGEDLKDEMKKIQVPVILLWGEQDRATPLKNARLMEKLIPHSELKTIKAAGHFPWLDKEEEFMRVFLGVLS